MKMHIRSRIVLPVLLVLFVLPLAVWLVFGAVSERFMEQISQQEIDTLLENIQLIAEDSFPVSNAATDPDAERAHSKEFVAEVKRMLRQTQNDAQLMILTSKLESIYPKNLDSQLDAETFYTYITGVASSKALKNDGYQRLFLDGKNYLIRVRQMEAGTDTRAKYLIAYNPLFDTAELRRRIGVLVFVITAALAGLSMIVVWKTADGIAKPMRRLCRYAVQIGDGNFRHPQEPSNLREVDELAQAMHEMSERLAKAEEMQKTFLQNASHELRTPLMSISGYAQGLQCGVFADNAEPIQAILSESQRLTELVGELLCLSRMDSEKEPLELRTLNLSELISGCLEHLAGLALERGVKLVFPAEDAELLVSVDERLFAQAFSNIASNAVRFAKSAVVVGIRQMAEHIIVTVEDDGDGISSEDMEHLFERFYKGKGGNCGLGLAIAKAAVEYMGGAVRAENGDSGAIFEIKINTQ